MKYLSLESYSDFSCIGGDCPYTCCGGWKIVIDEKTASYYQTVTGEIGERLRDSIVTEDGVSRIELDENGKCPMLNKRGLCDIVLNLGEEHLSNTCTHYPRYTFFTGDIRFAGVSISCPVVSRFFLTHDDPLEIDYSEDDAQINEEGTDWVLFNHAVNVFGEAVDIAQNRTLLIKERIALITILIYQFQSYVDSGKEPGGIIELFADSDKYIDLLPQTGIYDRDYENKIDFCSEIMGYFKRVDGIDHIVPELVELVDYFGESDHARVDPENWINVFSHFDEAEAQLWQEQILVYIIYRYLMRDFGNRDFLKKYLVGLLFVLEMGSCLMAMCMIKNDRPNTHDESIMIMSHISRMIEHSSSFSNQALTHFDEKKMTDLQFVLKLIS